MANDPDPAADRTADAKEPKVQVLQSLRGRLRLLLNSQLAEVVTITAVLVYTLFLILELSLPNFIDPYQFDTVNEYAAFIESWRRSAWLIDIVFLSVFLLELGFKISVFGFTHLQQDPLLSLDAVVVITAFALTIFSFEYMFSSVKPCDCETPGSVAQAAQLSGSFRLVRVFRALTVMNKVQSARDAAMIMRKKAQSRDEGSPVERVLDILQRIRRQLDTSLDRSNIAFIVDMIVSEQLYQVDVNQGGGTGNISSEVLAFMRNQGVTQKSKPIFQRRETKIDFQAASSARTRRHSGFRAVMDESTMWIDRMLEGERAANALARLYSWDFDVFALTTATNKHPVLALVMQLVTLLSLEDSLPINVTNLMRFLTRLEAGYNDVPFHNHVHAADVVHGTAYFMATARVAELLSPLDQYALILAAAMHDFNHPGYNNAFMVNSKHEKAVLYNDVSVLEMGHISQAWQLTLCEGLDPFEGFSLEQYTEARQICVQSVLGTDMKYHFEHLTKFKTRLCANESLHTTERSDVRLLLTMCLHAADVSNTAKPWFLTKEWAARIMEEFFLQGDQEQERGLPISPFMDRSKTNIAQCQIGFMNILIKPFYLDWCAWLGPRYVSEVFSCIDENIRIWKRLGEDALGERGLALKKPRSTQR